MTALKAHFENLLAAVKIEREEDRQQYQHKMMHTTFQERKERGICWYPVVVSKTYLSTGERIVLHLEKTTDEKQKHVFQAGSSVSLFVNTGGQKLPHVSGVVSQLREGKMRIVLNGDEEPTWLGDGKLGVNLLFDESTYEEMESTMRKMIAIAPNERAANLYQILLGHQSGYFNGSSFKIDYPELNKSQSNAVHQILSAQDVCAVHGPPGTGKTTTLVRAIQEVVAKEKQVMVTAPSNAAVDLLVEKLAKKGLNVVRIGHPARVTPAVVNNSLDARIAAHPEFKNLKQIRKKSEELRKTGAKYKRNFGVEERRQRKMLMMEAKRLKDEALALEYYITNDLLDKADVIACTLVGANHSLMKERYFKTVFIDEAGQALEPACWIPILRCNKLVMAGDHMQLPPTVKSMEATKKGLAITLFEQFIKKSHHQADNHSVNLLEVQYRMHEEIMQFSSDYFYEGKLSTDQSIGSRKVAWPEGAVFIDTAGCGFDSQLNEKTRSTYNVEEANFLVSRLAAFINDISIETFLAEERRVGIITPYKAQNEILNELIKSNQALLELGENLEVNTVDAFQGQERDVIVIGFVRSNPEGEIGFLKDIRRINVAMTRAKHHLIMIGDSATLGSLEFYNELVLHFQTINRYHSAFEFLM